MKNRKTDLDWLSANEDNVQEYINSELCGTPFTNASFSALFHLLDRMGKARKYHRVNEELKIMLAAGEDDPCTGGKKGRANSKKVLTKAGFKKFTVNTFEGMRHEILNERGKKQVYEAMLEFLEK